MLIQYRHLTLKLRQTFRIARNASDERRNILVRIGTGPQAGLGEIVPYPYYGQTCEVALELLPTVSQVVAKRAAVRSLADVEDIATELASLFEVRGVPRSRCNHVLAAVSGALVDHLCKIQGTALIDFVSLQAGGLARPGFPPSSYTLGIDTPEKMQQKLEASREFSVIKIKLGTTCERDMEIVRVIREATPARLCVDANAGWDREVAARMLPFLEEMEVEFVEQPLPPDDLEGFRKLAMLCRVPLFMDEGIVVSADVERVAPVCHGVNIKLSKCGGLLEALRMVGKARALGLQVMLGCMIESSVGIGAAYNLSPWVDFADLDGNILTANDPYEGKGNLSLQAGRVAVLRSEPGLGFFDESCDWLDTL